MDLLGEKQLELTVAGTAADSHRIPVFKDSILCRPYLPKLQIYRLRFLLFKISFLFESNILFLYLKLSNRYQYE